MTMRNALFNVVLWVLLELGYLALKILVFFGVFGAQYRFKKTQASYQRSDRPLSLEDLQGYCSTPADYEALDLLDKATTKQGERTDLNPNFHNNIMEVKETQRAITSY